MSEENKLLREYALDRSESAFAALVHRYIDLVYSAALRQMDGNLHEAEEVTQAVFVDLAKKAPSLLHHESLPGWLFTSTRFVAANHRRADLKRRAREQKAQLMIEQDSDACWEELRPILDAAMHELSDSDRRAVLLRFFQQESLAVVGEQFGISENAARMRIERALEKLRAALQKWGIHATTAGLAALLSTRAVTAAPVILAQKVLLSTASEAALAPAAGLMAILLTRKFLAVAVLLLAVGAAFWLNRGGTSRLQEPTVQTVAHLADSSDQPVEGSGENLSSPASLVSEPASDSAGAIIEIKTIAAGSDLPVANVPLEVRSWAGGKFRQDLFTTGDSGLARVAYRSNVTEIRIASRQEGFADTRLLWRPDRGDKIPGQYDLRLAAPVWIGGTVLDPDGLPVPGAKVSFGHSDEPSDQKIPETHAYSHLETVTGADGRWQANRIAPEMLARSSGQARHSNYVDSAYAELKESPEALEKLREGSFIFQLGKGIALSGRVVDEDGRGIEGATVATDQVGFASRRETATDGNGGFRIMNVKPGASYLSAQAEGYAPVSRRILIGEVEGTHELQLTRGRSIRFRVVNGQGEPIDGARVSLDSYHPNLVPPGEAQPEIVQFHYVFPTDAQGQAVWEHAPASLICFTVDASGYMAGQHVQLPPGENECVVTLENALTIGGIVRDAQTGEPLHEYRIGTGWPEPIYGTDRIRPRWSDIDRFWLTFRKPEFKHTFDEPVIHGTPIKGYIFKFEAEGYAAHVTRVIHPDEREVTFDIALARAASRTVQLLDCVGNPLAAASVAFLPDGAFLRAGPSGLQIHVEGIVPKMSDPEGRIQIPDDPELVRLVAAHTNGFLNTPISSLNDGLVIRVKPWGTITGQVRRNGMPAAGEMIIAARPENLHRPGQPPSPIAAVQFDLPRAKSDAHGNYILENVSPGDIRVIVVRQTRGPGGGIEGRHEKIQNVDLSSSEPAIVNFELKEDSEPVTP